MQDFSLIFITFNHQICSPWFYTTKKTCWPLLISTELFISFCHKRLRLGSCPLFHELAKIWCISCWHSFLYMHWINLKLRVDIKWQITLLKYFGHFCITFCFCLNFFSKKVITLGPALSCILYAFLTNICVDVSFRALYLEAKGLFLLGRVILRIDNSDRRIEHKQSPRLTILFPVLFVWLLTSIKIPFLLLPPT